ncbi:hypothetical protein D3C87_2002090 [compost metagenome]
MKNRTCSRMEAKSLNSPPISVTRLSEDDWLSDSRISLSILSPLRIISLRLRFRVFSSAAISSQPLG